MRHTGVCIVECGKMGVIRVIPMGYYITKYSNEAKPKLKSRICKRHQSREDKKTIAWKILNMMETKDFQSYLVLSESSLTFNTID